MDLGRRSPDNRQVVTTATGIRDLPGRRRDNLGGAHFHPQVTLGRQVEPAEAWAARDPADQVGHL